MNPVNGGRDEVTIFSYAALLESIRIWFKWLYISLVFDFEYIVLMFSIQMW